MAGEGEVDKVTPVFWGLFSAGGFVIAFLLPIFIVMNSLAYPFQLVPPGGVTYAGMLAWISPGPSALIGAVPWLTKLFVVAVVGGSLFHGMHRLKYILYDVGLSGAKRVLEPIVYGIAAVGTVAAVFLAFSFP